MAQATGVTTAERPRPLSGLVGKVRGWRLPWMPIIVLLMLAVCAIFAPLLAPYDPETINLIDARQAPLHADHWLGTDIMGRDILSRLIFGARLTAIVALTALGVSAVVGTSIGLIAGYAGGWIDTVFMRLTDAVQAFPSILAAMIVVAILGVGLENVIVAIAATAWARFSRMIRGDVLQAKERDFVAFARITGVSTPRVIMRHVFPNVLNTLLVVTSFMVGTVILAEASLSFLGLGLPPGAPGWGIMVAEGRQVITSVWWLSLLPGLIITAVVAAFNFFGDWIRDVLDPKLRQV